MMLGQPTHSPSEEKDKKIDFIDEKGDVLVQDVKKIEDLYEEGSIDPIYEAKARVLNRAIQEIGMGKYQVCPLRWLSAASLLISSTGNSGIFL